MSEFINVPEIFGSDVFNEATMKQRLTPEVYLAWKECIQNSTPLDLDVANHIAEAMKVWAIEKGATHYTHWFQPMTGITAEKHDSFISPTGDGKVIMDFSGKELVRGEPDASSFPNGGLRTTFEARGYTAWDPTSFAFVRDGSLYIPTCFFSYTGESLDQKTPLLRSLEEVSREALRILRLFGDTKTKRVLSSVGAEQEYFIIPRSMYAQREDLRLTGRTLFGAKPPKGQEMDDHYFGTIRNRISSFMKDLDERLWRLGVLSKTKHNEAAPCQHEMAPIYSDATNACDANQLVMAIMKKCAAEHDLVCLLHEKPFEGVNGSGKHNNWSLSTDTGRNLFKPGDTPAQNAQFLVFLAAFIKGVDEYQDFLRCTVASAGNDHRLGANEAPPAIVSIFLGEDLEGILEDISCGVHHDNVKRAKMNIGAEIIPAFRKDNTDRNRTSPFAFTGNKFEFRGLGSAASISDTNVMLNTMVADVFCEFADRLEKAEDFECEVKNIIKEVMDTHRRIIFNGDGYSKEWEVEAEKRGLLNLKSTVDALPMLKTEKNIALFEKHGVFSKTEINSRVDIILENYSKIIHIEALTLLDMMTKEVIPAISAYTDKLCTTLLNKNKIGGINSDVERELIYRLSAAEKEIFALTEELKMTISTLDNITDVYDKAVIYHDKVLKLMDDIRKYIDINM